MQYLWSIIGYLIILVVVGAWRSQAVKSQDDFMVAGRRLSAKVLIGTLLATWIGSGSIIAGAGLAYDRGMPALWFSAGVWMALFIQYFVAGRARAFGQYTVPDILEVRYNQWARVLGTLVTIIAYTAIVSYQFRAGGMVLNMVAGIPVEQGIILTAVFVIAYTALAGMISVAYTDVVNGVVLLLGFIIGFPFLLKLAGGWGNVVATLPDYAVVARVIGGDRVSVECIVRGDQDAHFIRPKPSFVDMVARADVLIATGLDLELWLPTVVNKHATKLPPI